MTTLEMRRSGFSLRRIVGGLVGGGLVVLGLGLFLLLAGLPFVAGGYLLSAVASLFR